MTTAPDLPPPAPPTRPGRSAESGARERRTAAVNERRQHCDVASTDSEPDHGPAEVRCLLAPAALHLGQRDRTILRMRFVDGLTQAQIADALGITQVQVSRLLARTYRDLRRGLGPVPTGDR